MRTPAPVRGKTLAIPSLVIALSLLCVECGRRHDTLTGPSDVAFGNGNAALLLPSDTELPAIEISTPEVFVGAGDIALCTADGNPEATARLLDAIGGTVFALGDNAYMSGTAEEYRDCYDRTWGRHRIRTRPVPGNHEYESPQAAPYFDYFGFNAGPHGLGYYSFNLGAWHLVALNSNVAVSAGSAQAAWLRADLAANRARCTLAYWHHPRFSSGRHGNEARMRDFWQILYEAGADIVLSAHDHTYERFAPQDPEGFPDNEHGIRQFVAGTGGARPSAFVNIGPNSEARLATLGVLKLTLSGSGYDWEFISVSGPGDSGSGSCH
jgi:3',5'-cyclic AMP phosphodiesterase CpdA